MSKQSKSKDPSSKGRAVGQAVVELFDKMSLHGDAAVDIAVVKLDHLLADPSIDIDEVVELMTSVQHLLEFVLCVSSDYGFGILSIAILQRQPSTAEDYPSSLLYKLLAQLSRSLCLPYERTSDTPPVLSAHRRSIELAFSVLQAVTHLNATDALAEQMGDDPGSGRWAAKNEEKRHQKRKRSIHTGRAPPVDIVKSIIQYGAPVPTSKRQAAELVTTVVAEQTSILQEVFNMFRKEETIAFFKTTYLPIPPAPTPLTVTIPTQRTRSATTALTPFVPMTGTQQGAFPLVQPIKAALYFENADGFGAWRIQMSTRADRDLRRWRNEDAKMFDIIVNKIKDLSHGNFTKDNHKKLTGVEVDIPIYEAKMTRDSRLVYHIHCDIDFEDNVERQVIRIFGVYTHAQIDGRFWDTMSRQLGYNGSEYRRRCIFRDRPSNQRGDYTVLPASFEVRSDTEQEVVTPSSSTTDHPDLTREDKEELHSLIALEKFVTFSQAFLNSILADQDVAHVFGVSHREKEIIEHDSSCFVIGRSGTGKTTTMVFKILGIERTYDTGSFRYAMAKPRQLFVTQSQVLAKKVEEYYAKLHQSYATAHLSPDELLEIASQSRTRRERMVDEDEEIFYTSTLPRRFGALEDTHFPLFLTYNHLCRLLENEFRHLVEQEKIDAHRASLLRDIMKLRPRPTRTRPAAYLQEERDTFLDYDTFREIYWSHFPENPLNPDLVWGEFVAVIKGSAGALKSDLGYLDKETYVGHGHSRSQTVSPAQRETVYALFEVYTKRRKLHGHHDPADRTRMLIRCLKAAGVPGKALNFIYVDEAQDNFLIDSLVLKALCSNPHGLFWAGDTAQTIAAGSSFRLGDLKAQLYDVEKNPLSISKRARPQTFYLTRNYRSHSGIVDCAHSIVELITNYWSTAIDDLPRERGMSPGEKPIFFSDHDAAKLQQSLFRDVSGGGVIEFGARQCIIVRDHAARDRLKSEFGKIGQVLTIYESKGLEFDDVLLYNFFEDSSMNHSQWRVLLNSIPGHPAPNYDDGRHSGICRELKHLYVAITRARQNLWITDCSQKAEPLRLLWATKGVVEEHIPGTPIPKLAKSSRKEEWANAARSLFVKRQYSEAVDAFERAGLAQERRVALAYHLRDSARMSPVNARGKELSQSAAFSRAAEGFVAAAQGAGEPEDQRTYYRIAAECYVRCGDSGKAGAAYRHAREYTLSAQHFRKAGMFDDAVEVIQVHETDVRPDVAQSIIEVSKLYYIKEQKLAKARSLFKNDDEVLEYMDDRDLNAPRASFHEEREEFDDAAECHLREGDDLKAIKLFLLNYRKRQSAQSLLRAVTCILDGLWLYMSLGAPEGNWEDQKLVEILGHAEVVFPRLQDGILRNEIAMFRAIWQNDIPALAELGEWFHTRDEHHPAGLLCLDHVFAHDFGLESAALSEIASCFQTFLVYARTLSRYSCDPNPCQNSHIQKLFTFRRVNSDNEELFFLPKGSYLFSRALDGGATILEETTAQGIYILRWNLERLAKTALRERLKDRVLNQNEICHKLLCLRPCLLYATNQFCPRRGCPQLHIDPSPKEARATYNNLIRIHVLHIMIFHTLYATDIPYLILDKQRKAWLRRLYEALYPVSDNIGSLHTLTLASIPELTTGRHIIAVWIQDSLNRFDHDKDPAHIFLVNLMRTTRLAMLLDRRAAFSQLQRIPCAIRDREKRPQYLVRWGDRYIVNDLIAAMQCGYPGALDRGVQFLNHVLYNRLQVDIGVLCDFMDQLCGAMLISLHLRNKGTLHGLTLPKSWLVRLLQDTDQLATMKTEKSPKYVACMNQLLRDICTGNKASHLLFENLNMSSRGLNMTREVFIEKICRNICFWGLNLPIPQLRQWIHQTISGLQHVGRDIMSHTSSAYIYAEDWHSLAQAAVKSVASSSLDEVVYLCCSASDPPRSPPNVRLVRYQNIEDLISLLDATHIVQLSCNTADVKADSRTNASGGPLPASRPSDYDSQPMTGTTAVLSEESNAEDEDNEQHQVEFTDIQITAASKIISTYRGYIQRKAFEKDQLTEMRRRVYEDFLTTSPTIERRGSPYRFLFLGIVPNLFAVTECLKDHMYKAKSSAKESLRNAHDRELEDVQAALDDASRLFKEACRLHKALAPSATVHKSRDVQKLQEHALAVESLVKQLEDAISADSDVTFPWMEDWRLYELAYHALVKATSQLEEA